MQPGLVRCLRCFLDEQPCRPLRVTVKRADIGGGGCLDDLRETRLQDLLREKTCQDCVTDHALDTVSLR